MNNHIQSILSQLAFTRKAEGPIRMWTDLLPYMFGYGYIESTGVLNDVPQYSWLPLSDPNLSSAPIPPFEAILSYSQLAGYNYELIIRSNNTQLMEVVPEIVQGVAIAIQLNLSNNTIQIEVLNSETTTDIIHQQIIRDMFAFAIVSFCNKH